MYGLPITHSFLYTLVIKVSQIATFLKNIVGLLFYTYSTHRRNLFPQKRTKVLRIRIHLFAFTKISKQDTVLTGGSSCKSSWNMKYTNEFCVRLKNVHWIRKILVFSIFILLNINELNLRSTDSVVGTETGLRAGYPRNCILIPGRGSRYISSSNSSNRFLKLSGFLFGGYRGCVKRLGRETHRLYPTSAEFKIESYSFPIYLHGLHSDKFKSNFEMLRVNGSRHRFQSGC